MSLVKQHVAPLRPQRGVAPTPRFETTPGERAQCDWADFGALVYPDGRRKLYIFAYTMGYSRRMSIEFVHDQRQETLFACGEHAFAYFECVPGTVLSDNMTPMVVSHPLDQEVVWNPRFCGLCRLPRLPSQGGTPVSRPHEGEGGTDGGVCPPELLAPGAGRHDPRGVECPGDTLGRRARSADSRHHLCPAS